MQKSHCGEIGCLEFQGLETNLIKKLLADCKSWNGPFTSGEEMIQVIKSRPDQEEFIVKTELAFFAHTHKTDKLQRPELFRQNKITHEEKVENLLVLLCDDAEQSSATTANLPTNADVLKVLKGRTSTTATSSSSNAIEVNRLCIVMWADNKSNYSWYVGYMTNNETGQLIVDHTEREVNSSNKTWRYPSKPDIRPVEKSQILNVEVKGEWEYESRYNKFILRNEKEISYAFKNSTA